MVWKVLLGLQFYKNNFSRKEYSSTDWDIYEGLNGLTDWHKTAKNLVDSRKNWKNLTVSSK